MKRLLFIFVLLLFFTSTPILAEEETVTTDVSLEEVSTDNTITISPSLIIIDENDLGKTFEITIENKTDQQLTLYASEKFVRRKEGKIVPVELEDPGSFLEFNQDDFVVGISQKYVFKVRIKLSIDKFQAYPAISFSESEKGELLTVGAEILSVFLLQDFDGTILMDTKTVIDQPNIALKKQINVTGDLKNTGEKFFNPAGTVKIFKNETLLYEKQITTQIEGWLFPEESKSFSLSWTNDLPTLESIGNYTIETNIQSFPYSRITTNTINFFFFPSELLLYGIPGITGLVVLILLVRFIIGKFRLRSYIKSIS